MGLFDKLISIIKPDIEYPKSMSQEEYAAHRQAERDKLESMYDLNSIDGINAISVSTVTKPVGTGRYPGRIEYYLKAKAGQHEKDGNIELAVACLRKSNEIKYALKIGYNKEHYLAIVKLLRQYRRFDEARIEEEKIEKFFKGYTVDTLIDCERKIVEIILSNARKLGTDLVEMSVHGCTCSECAKYQGRWFSLSGKSQKYPKVPDEFFIFGGLHKGCGHTFHPVIEGSNSPQLEYKVSVHKPKNMDYAKDIVTFSNRPFIDDRIDEEKQRAYEHQEQKAQELLKDEEREIDRKHYNWLWEYAVDICPKSFNGYRRMKSANSEKFKKLCEEAKRRGRDLLG